MSTPEAPARPGGSTRFAMLLPLRLRDFRLLWVGMTVSLLGDGIFFVALVWQVYELSNVPSAMATVGVAMTVPHLLLLLLGGVVSDRFDRRRVLIAADTVRGVTLVAMGVLSLTGHLRLWHVLVLVALYGAGTAFFGPAFDAIVPDLVPADLLARANALDQLVRPSAWRLAGPAVGGLVIAAWGAGGAFLADAVTFGVSIAAVLFMHPHPIPREPGDEEASAWADVREGYRFVRSRVWLWGTFLAATLAYLIFLGPTEVLLPYVVKNQLRGSASDLGFILAMGGLGAITAAVVVGSRGMPRRHMTVMYVVWTISTLSVAGYGLATANWQAMATCFTFNAMESTGLIIWTTTKGRLVPARLLGRVSSLDWFISIGLLPVSYALTGPAAAAIGARGTLIAAGVVGGAITFAFLFLPGMRDIERRGLFGGSQMDAAGSEAEGGSLVPVGVPD